MIAYLVVPVVVGSLWFAGGYLAYAWGYRDGQRAARRYTREWLRSRELCSAS